MNSPDPYKTLGVTSNDSLAHIEGIYKRFMLLLHPDRANTQEAIALNLSTEKKNEYLYIIRNAYKKILSLTIEKDFPENNINYEIEQDVRITQNPKQGKNYTNEMFNKDFGKVTERDANFGIKNPFERGYNDFDTGKNFNESGGDIKPPTYSSSVDTTQMPITNRNEMKDNRLVEFLPEFGASDDNKLGFEELGISNVSDFSMTMNGKGGIIGTDLMSAYGSNHENWDDTFKKDTESYSKYINKGDINVEVNKRKSEVVNFKPTSESDYALLNSENARLLEIETQEKLRLSNLSKRDEYYGEMNRAQLPSRF